MGSSLTASEADLCRLAAIVTAERADLSAHGLPPSLLSDLRNQIPCDLVQFQGFDSGRQDSWFFQAVPDDDGDQQEPDGELERARWRHYWDSEPCSYPDRSGDLRSVVKIADFYSDRQWQSSGMYSQVYRPQGIRHELQLCLPAPPRAHPPTRPDRPAVPFPRLRRRLLRRRLLRTRPGPPHSDPAAPAPRLPRRRTPPRPGHPAHAPPDHPAPPGRRRATNTQIARRLGLAEGTVRTHLENIYARLGVSSRTAAVLRAFPNRDL